jgi:tRNA uridine 5-carboxymethylaminomethyl modification enzyme
MFTSRAEHRLLLNHGSAELRLAHHSKSHKLLDENRLIRITDKISRIRKRIDFLESNRSNGDTWGNIIRRVGQEVALPQDFMDESPQVRHEVLYRIGYQGYLERELREVDRLRHVERIRIPLDLDYLSIPGLRRESALKLANIKPLTLGQASRMSGVNPTDISLLMVAIEAGREGDSTV